LRFTNEKRFRSYLLGTLSPERAEQLEERLLKDEGLVEQLSLIEDELIEDYVRKALTASERKQFETYFLSNPRRRRKLMLVRGLRKYTADVGYAKPADRSPERRWFFPFLSPQWRALAAAVLILIVGVTAWRVYFRGSDLDQGLQALNEAYQANRPVEARVTGLSYAPFSPMRGSSNVNRRKLDLSAALLQKAVDEKSSPETLHALGRLYLFNREFDKAIFDFEEALKTTPDDPRLQSDLGAALMEKGKVERATDQSGRSETTLARSLQHLNRALELDDSLLDAHFNRALLYEQMRLSPQALAEWEKYVLLDPNSPWAEEARRRIEEIRKRGEKVSRRDDDLMRQFFEARTAADNDKMWQLFSSAHLRTGNTITSKLIDSFLAAAITPGRSIEAASYLQTLTELGKLMIDKTGDRFTADVAEVYRSARPGEQKPFSQARQDVAAAYLLYNQSKHDLAIPLYTRARNVFDELGNHPEALLASFWIGFCFMQRSDAHDTISLLQQVEQECAKRGYKWLQSITEIALANAHADKTNYSQAIEHCRNSYRESRQIADKNGELRSLNMLASLYRDLGNYRRSLQMAQQGLHLGTEISADASQMVGFYATSAWSFNSLGHYPAALAYEKQAMSLGEQLNNPLVQSRYLVQMGLIQTRLKNYDEAIRDIRRGIEVGQRVGEETIGKEMSTYGQLYLSRAYRESGRLSEAMATLASAENFDQRGDNRLWFLHEVKKEQLLTRIAQGDVVGAREELARVLRDYENHRQKILEENNRKSFFDKEQSIYDVAIDFAQSSLSDTRQAFDYSENSRGRSLLDASRGDWRVADDENVPDLRFSSASKPMPLDQFQQNLPRHVQLLQFAVLKQKLIIWYLAHDRFESAVVNVSNEELMDRVDQLLRLVTNFAGVNDKQLQRTSAELYDLLIVPLAQFLDRQKQLCIVPDKILHLLPFNVLFSRQSQRYLVEDFALSYSASANVFIRDSELASEKANAGDEALLGVGNPSFDRKTFPDLSDLPTANREVDEIGRFYNQSSLLRNGEATKRSVLTAMRTADVLHFATHYVPDGNSPMLGKLLLASESIDQRDQQARNGVLQAYEVYSLKPLRARLAILAACQTGVEEYVNGEGPIGLARPFNTAGVPLVVASLWPVDSLATTELMIEFHRLRRIGQLSTAAALQAAQVQMLKQENSDHRSPYYWASFSLNGGYSNY
jgi:CHAT domain-containing protein